MFIGGLPKETLQQVARVFPLASQKLIYVCCSGSFRLEQLIHQVAPGVPVVGNDVSLLTCSIGTLAAERRVFPFRFTNDLAFLEELLPSAEEAAKPVELSHVNEAAHARIAAILVAGQMGRHSGRSEFDRKHREHYRSSFTFYQKRGMEKLARLLESFRLSAFIPRDFRKHAREAMERGAAVLGFPPTYKGGYENLYKFVNANLEWQQPEYDVFDPRNVEQWVRELHDSGTPYCVGADRRFETLEPVASFTPVGKHTLYVYASTERSSFSRTDHKLSFFRYEPVKPAELHANTVVKIVPADSQQMNFLKEHYLARNIAHTAGRLMNFLVYLDGRLAGGFIYARDKFRENGIYLLSDFSITRGRKVSKLIAMLACSKDPIAIAERKLLAKVERISTTAFTRNAVSMKYRGVLEVSSRKEDHVQYEGNVRPTSPQETYHEWFTRHAGTIVEEAKRNSGA